MRFFLLVLVSAWLSFVPRTSAAAEAVTPAGNVTGQGAAQSDPLRLENAQLLLGALHFQELLKFQIHLKFTEYRGQAQKNAPDEIAKKMEVAFQEIIALTDAEIDYPAYERDMAGIFADLYTAEELTALTTQSTTALGRKFITTRESLLQRWNGEENRRLSQLGRKINDIYQRNLKPQDTTPPPAPTAAELPGEKPRLEPLPGRLTAGDFSADLATLQRQSEVVFQDSYAEVQRALQALQSTAHAHGELGIELGCMRRLLNLPHASEQAPPTPSPVNREPATAATNADTTKSAAKPLAFSVVDRLAMDARRVADQRLGELYRPVRNQLQTAFATALRETRAEDAAALWSILSHVPQEWSSELLKEPMLAQPDYDRTNAVPITALPAYLELTVEPGGHDVHVGVCGFEDEDITEIYLGGWWGRVSGIRARPGSQEEAKADHFQLFDAQRKLPDELTLLRDDTQGTPFNAILPTTFRIAVSTCGIVVSRVERGQETVIMQVDHLFNNPTSFTFKSPTYRLLSTRVSPATTWSNEAKRKRSNPQGKVDF